MKGRVFLSIAAATAIVTAAFGSAAFAGSGTDRATGGGQILTPSGNGGGPGDTLAFNAQARPGTGAGATGQLQYVTHGNNGSNVAAHGTVSCLVVSTNGSGQGTADIAGTWTSGLSGNWELQVVDTGEGQGNADPVMWNSSDDGACNHNGSPTSTSFGRGNVQVYDAP